LSNEHSSRGVRYGYGQVVRKGLFRLDAIGATTIYSLTAGDGEVWHTLLSSGVDVIAFKRREQSECEGRQG